ncbi:hypothetical protein Vafri_11955 [Volvox africanus]|uniref:Uncharacterized protein n=1 Tax=Volvox africanus TaxID=51714 RepID=A0A8J4B960_9CHLO|nr:hypothetical protein Vafri_11955 [Volvox africanus]
MLSYLTILFVQNIILCHTAMDNSEDLNRSGLRRSKRERQTKQQLLPDSYGEPKETCTDSSEYEEAGQHESDVDTELNVNSNGSKKRRKSQDVAAGPNGAATRFNNDRVQGKYRRRRHRARAAGEDGPGPHQLALQNQGRVQ